MVTINEWVESGWPYIRHVSCWKVVQSKELTAYSSHTGVKMGTMVKAIYFEDRTCKGLSSAYCETYRHTDVYRLSAFEHALDFEFNLPEEPYRVESIAEHLVRNDQLVMIYLESPAIVERLRSAFCNLP